MRKTNFAIISCVFPAGERRNAIGRLRAGLHGGHAQDGLVHEMEGIVNFRSFFLWMVMVIAPYATRSGLAQPASAAPQDGSSIMGAQGTMHIKRLVPLPATISQQARDYLTHP